jgi:GAF domain-containing protein
MPAFEAVVRNRRLRQLQDRLARAALGVSPTAFVANLGAAMRELAEILDVSTAFVDEIAHHTSTLDVLGAWDEVDGVGSLPRRPAHRPDGTAALATGHRIEPDARSWRTSLPASPPGSRRSRHTSANGNAPVRSRSRLLFALGYPIGMLGVRTNEPGRRFTPEEVAALKSIAATIAQGLARIRDRAHAAPTASASLALDDASDLICVTDLLGMPAIRQPRL